MINFISIKTTDDIQKLTTLAGTIWHGAFTDILTLEQIDYMVVF